MAGKHQPRAHAPQIRPRSSCSSALDPDHMRFPEFLDRVIGHFRGWTRSWACVQVTQGAVLQTRGALVHRGLVAARKQTLRLHWPGARWDVRATARGLWIRDGASVTLQSFRRTALRNQRHGPRVLGSPRIS
jgi:hypothetical protein